MNDHADQKPKDLGYLLTAYADGELNAEGRAWVEAQLQDNAALRARLEQIRSIQNALRKHLPMQAVPTGLDASRREALLKAARKPRSQPIAWSGIVIRMAAACLVLAVIAAIAIPNHLESRVSRTVARDRADQGQAMACAALPASPTSLVDTAEEKDSATAATTSAPPPGSAALFGEAPDQESPARAVLYDGRRSNTAFMKSMSRADQDLAMASSREKESDNKPNKKVPHPRAMKGDAGQIASAAKPAVSITPAVAEDRAEPRVREEAVATSEMSAPSGFMAIGASGGADVSHYRKMKTRGFDGGKKEVDPAASLRPELPALDTAQFAALLQAPRINQPTAARMPGAACLDDVILSAQMPTRLDDETKRQLQGMQRTVSGVLTGGTLTHAQALTQIARSLDLQVLPAGGVMELQSARAPLDPGSSCGLDVDAFRKAFGTEPMRPVTERPQITSALDGDTASYALAKARVAQHQPIEAATVRPEHFINAMPNDLPAAQGPEAFALYAEAAPSPFPVAYPLARGRTPLVVAVGVVGRAAAADERRPLRLTLAVDASGSMAQSGGLERIRRGLAQLVGQLRAEDRVAIVAFADAARIILPATPGDQTQRIVGALATLSPSGSTNAVDGLMLAYQLAAEQVQPGTENRVVLASDGAALSGGGAQLAVDKARQWRGRGISLLVLGCGDERGDAVALGTLADRCDGQHVQLASDAEANRVFASTLLPARLGILARDAKLQVTWNPERVAWARLIGYDQRRIADQDFRNDAVDAGELNHETRLTALYEIIPTDGAAGPLGAAAVRYYDTRLEQVRELACPMPGSVLTARISDRLRLLACAAETAEWLQRGWWSNVRLPQPERIRAVLATCPQSEARELEAMLGPVTP